MTRRQLARVIAGAVAVCVSRGEAILASLGRPSMHSSRPKNKGKMPSPRCLGEYPGEVVPMGDISRQSEWSG
jgi:hypothetical protein